MHIHRTSSDEGYTEAAPERTVPEACFNVETRRASGLEQALRRAAEAMESAVRSAKCGISGDTLAVSLRYAAEQAREQLARAEALSVKPEQVA